MRKKITNQVKDHAFHNQQSNLVIYSLTKFRRACDSSFIYEDAAFWLFRGFMNGVALAVNKQRLALSSNDENQDIKTLKIYAEVSSSLLGHPVLTPLLRKLMRRSVVLKVSLAPWCFSETFYELTLQCSGVYSKESLRVFYAELMDRSICSTTQCS